MKKLILNKATSKRSTNVDNSLSVEAFTERKLLPTDDVVETVDAYQEYVKEKDASDRYRLAFTINPVCSNILFNANTEIIDKEGSNDAQIISRNRAQGVPGYKEAIRNVDIIEDTAFSHPDIANYEYHCGLDIFDNHLLRAKDFTVVNKRKNGPDVDFNGISDFMRDSSGKVIQKKITKPYDDNGTSTQPYLEAVETSLHLYTKDNIRSFGQSINDNLVESDGWVGFINPVTLNVQNVTIDGKEISVNKCINNKGGGEFIDMYPGRDLYSFIPKVNPYRKRLEKNWDYCLTYPYKSEEDERFVRGKSGANGLRCTIVTNLSGTVFDDGANSEENGLVYFRTQFSNTFQKGDSVNFTLFDGSLSIDSIYPLTVVDVGYMGEDTKHYFAVNLSDIYALFSELAASAYLPSLYDYEEDFLDENGMLKSNYEIIVRKRVNGIDCKYYIRKFRKIPNFNGENINVEDGVSEEEINSANKEFGSSISKLAFSENIFSDKIAQILYDEDVVLTGLRDNMGRPLSEIYLTIVKRNAGHNNIDINDSSVEYSRCFGEVTSGFDMSPEEENYNVHRIYNVTNGEMEDNGNLSEYSVNVVENDITIDGKNGVFIGDLIEFSPYTVTETVLEDIYHRFNTEQREKTSTIISHEIKSDDYDIDGFSASTKADSEKASSHEGYYYKPHYRIPIRQYSTTVMQGQHKRIVFIPESLTGDGNGLFTGTTAVNQYLCQGDKLYIYSKEDGGRVEGTVNRVTGKNFTHITFEAKGVTDITKYNIFKINPEMPSYSYDLMDATGRYLWREELSDSALTIGDELYNSIFTNGAHYRHTRVNFYLRRQDPTGVYGLNTANTWDFVSGASTGNVKEYEDVEHIEEGVGNIC